jgi:hypothetical protein
VLRLNLIGRQSTAFRTTNGTTLEPWACRSHLAHLADARTLSSGPSANVSVKMARAAGAMAQVRAATVASQVALSLAGDFENYSEFVPRAAQNDMLAGMLNDLVRWAEALQSLRSRA